MFKMTQFLKYVEAVGLKDKLKTNAFRPFRRARRKRIGIARTLILKPEIVLYDEPTAGLDPVTCALK